MGCGPEKFLAGLSETMQRLPHTQRISVAFSGGPDSSVLLQALVLMREAPGVNLPLLRALHVNHGLQPQAPAWARHCQAFCRARDVELSVLDVSVSCRASQSLEDAARRARYQALGGCLDNGEILCTAHHATDQAETLVIQLLRGAGPRGLAAMPAQCRFQNGYLLRPMLDVDQDLIMECVQHWELAVVMDPSNQDPRFARARIRQWLLGSLLEQFPSAVKTLNRSARLQAAASEAIDTLAGLDMQQCLGSEPGTLMCETLVGLSQTRRLEVLRCWLRDQGLGIPNQARLLEMSRQMTCAGVDRQPVIRWPGGEVRRYRNVLHALRPGVVPAQDFQQRWHLDEVLSLPWGRLWSEPALGQGLRLEFTEVDVRLRQGGERCRLAGQGHSRSLKHLLQEKAVPPWQRRGLPLIHTASGLAAVAGLWVFEDFQAQAGEPGRVIHWQPM